MMVRKSGVWAILGLAVPAAFAAHQVTLPTSLAEAGTQVVDVHVGLSYSEGPAVDPAGNLFFSEDPDVNTGRIWKITPQGEKSIFKDPSRGSNGLEFDNQGRLHIAMLDSVLRVETNGQVTVLAAKGTLNLARVNDLSISSSGTLFFTNLNGNTLFFRNASGQISTRTVNGVNGVEWIEEKNIVYVGGNNLQKCQVDNATGVLSNCAQFAGATDGLTVDVQGNVWRANWSEGKIYAHDSTGKELGSIAIDAAPVQQPKRSSQGAMGNASNCHHGGPDLKTLYITGDGGLYSIKLKVAGRRRPQWPTAVQPQARLAKASRDGQGSRFWNGTAGYFLLDLRQRPVALDGKRLP